MSVKSLIVRFRSAITGRFVKRDYAEKHPKQTVKETDKKP